MAYGVRLHEGKVLWLNGRIVGADEDQAGAYLAATGKAWDEAALRDATIAWPILSAHHQGEAADDQLRLKFDSITSHDITYVGIIQTARASGMTRFPIPYVLTNCHNSLCAVGGTINEDDHKFGLSAVKKYGGIYVPPNLAVIHSYNRERMAGCGRMILGSDSHTRYGALGTIAIGEGGGELAKQLLEQTYDIRRPEVVGIVLSGEPRHYVGPQDVALAIIKAVYDSGFTKNRIMEFIGDGVAHLPMEFRNGIDVMTTETTCLSSIWRTDDQTAAYLEAHGRSEDYRELREGEAVLYDGIVEVDLNEVEPMIALPYHPSNVYAIREVQADPHGILSEAQERAQKLFENTAVKVDLLSKIRNGRVWTDQGVIVGCSGGTFDNIVAAAQIVKGHSTGENGYNFSVYAGSQPAFIELAKNGAVSTLMESGAIIKPAFCGPCFGAGDTPGNNELSIRHATRNFPNRDGSKPGEGQISMVALMDARSIAATAINGGALTSASQIDWTPETVEYRYDETVYRNKVVDCRGAANPEETLILGPNIKDWPEMPELSEAMFFEIASHIDDPVTTTDELIPSGETSSYRSNPLRLAEFTLSRKDPDYVATSKRIHAMEKAREAGEAPQYDWVKRAIGELGFTVDFAASGIGSAVYANKPGDGSAREQAASCQRVIGGWANFAKEYATKRYRSNLLNWGIVPFVVGDGSALEKGAVVFVPKLRSAIASRQAELEGFVLREGRPSERITLTLGELTDTEREILSVGSLINYNRKNR